MRNYKTLLDGYEQSNVPLIHHRWGQNKLALYNQIVRLWNGITLGDKIVIISNEKLGIKSAVRYLAKTGLHPTIVGKGAHGLRVVEVVKDNTEPLPEITTRSMITFEFNGHTYRTDVGDATFSKTGLDDGTKFLLEIVYNAGIDLNSKMVGDFGSGWGAIAMVLATEFPQAKILAYENDPASLEASRLNLEMYSTVSVQEADILKCGYFAPLDYIVANPPFHIREEEREAFFVNAHSALKKGGEMFFVAEGSFVERFRQSAKRWFASVEERDKKRYVVFRCKTVAPERESRRAHPSSSATFSSASDLGP